MTRSVLDQSRGSRPKAPAKSPAAPGQFTFVTATALNDFKTKETMTTVRKKVMETYLSNEVGNPDTKDPRVTKKRPKTSSKSSNSPPPLAAKTAPGGPLPAPGRSMSEPTDLDDASLTAGACLYWPATSPFYSTPGGSSVSDAVTRVENPNLSDEKLFRRFPPPPPPEDSVAHSPVAERAASDPTSPASASSNTSLLPIRSRRDRLVYDVAYSAPYGLNLIEVTPDPFASCARLSNDNVNVELLKYNCERTTPRLG